MGRRRTAVAASRRDDAILRGAAAIRSAGAARGNIRGRAPQRRLRYASPPRRRRRAGSQAAAHAGFACRRAGKPSRAALRCPSHRFPDHRSPAGEELRRFRRGSAGQGLENAAQEGFDSSELLKRYSTVGMGPSQGKHSNMNALRILGARYRGVGVEQLGLTTARPMYHPVPLKLLAGRSFHRRAAHSRSMRGTQRSARFGCRRATGGDPSTTQASGESRAQSIEAEVRGRAQRASGSSTWVRSGRSRSTARRPGSFWTAPTPEVLRLEGGYDPLRADAGRVGRHHR